MASFLKLKMSNVLVYQDGLKGQYQEISSPLVCPKYKYYLNQMQPVNKGRKQSFLTGTICKPSFYIMPHKLKCISVTYTLLSIFCLYAYSIEKKNRVKEYLSLKTPILKQHCTVFPFGINCKHFQQSTHPNHKIFSKLYGQR